MASIQDKSSILIYRVGPVLCCAPCLSVISITHPTPLTKLPGQQSRHSGIFKFGNKLVNVCELRINFGVDPEYWIEPGRIIITELLSGYVGFWVDEILDVLESPDQGWGKPPPLIPSSTFTKTLYYHEEIHLYAEFKNLYEIKQIGYLKSYIEHLTKIKLEKNSAIKSDLLNSIISSDKNKISDTKNNNQKITTCNNPTLHSQAELTQHATLSLESSVDAAENIIVTNVAVTPNTATTPDFNIKPDGPNTIQVKKVSNVTKRNINFQTQHNHKFKTQTPFIPPTHNQNNPTTQQPLSESQNVPVVIPHGSNLHLDKRKTNKITISNNKETDSKYIYKTTNTDKTTTGLIVAAVSIISLLLAIYLFNPFDSTVKISSIAFEKIKPIKTKGNSPDIVINESYKKSDNSSATEIKETDTINDSYPDKKIQKENNNDLTEKMSSDITNNSLAKLNAPNTGKLPNAKNQQALDMKQSAYSAEFTKNSDGITITLHSPMSKKPDSNLKSESTATTSKAGKQKTEQYLEPEPLQTTEKKTSNYQIEIHSKQAQQSLTISDSTISKEIIHIVVKGDTLWHIAKFYVDDPYRYPELARLSNIQNPDLIYPGDRVQIIQIFTTETNQDE